MIPTHISKHTLDLIITRQSDQLGISKPWTDYLFSDHMPVHCQFTISKPSLRKTQISFRKTKSINVDTLRAELLSSELCTKAVAYNLNDLVKCYNDTLKSALDRHAPVVNKTVTKRPTVPWFTNDVKSAKLERRGAERKWRKTKLHSDFLTFRALKNHATIVMKWARKNYTSFIEENSHDQRKLFRSAKTLFDQETDLSFQGYSDSTVLANDIGNFFVQKIERIRTKLDEAATSSTLTAVQPSICSTPFDSFTELTEDDVMRLIANSNKKTCSLDPMPTLLWLSVWMFSCLSSQG